MHPQVIAAIISASAGFVGALVGAGISLITTRVLERKRWEREDRLRFTQQRFAAYSALLRAVNRLNSLKTVEERRDDADGVAELLGAWAEVELVGSEVVRERAQQFVGAVNDVLLSFQPHLPVDTWGNTRIALMNAIREEFGVDKPAKLPV